MNTKKYQIIKWNKMDKGREEEKEQSVEKREKILLVKQQWNSIVGGNTCSYRLLESNNI